MRRTVLIALVALVATPAVSKDVYDILNSGSLERREQIETQNKMLLEMQMQGYTQDQMLNEQRYQSDIKTLELNTLSGQGIR